MDTEQTAPSVFPPFSKTADDKANDFSHEWQ